MEHELESPEHLSLEEAIKHMETMTTGSGDSYWWEGMVWGDGSMLGITVGSLWVICNIVISFCYVRVIGRAVLNNAEVGQIKKRIWGSFIYSCGIGHMLMVGYMAVYPSYYLFIFVTFWDLLTAVASLEAAYRSPDLPT